MVSQRDMSTKFEFYQDEAEDEYTFTPEISPLAKSIVHREPLEARAKSVLAERERNLKKLAEDIEQSSRQEAPFRPTITPYEFKTQRQHFIASLEELTKQRKIKINRLEEEALKEEEERATFKPKISAYSSSLKREGPIFDRLYKAALQKDYEEQDQPPSRSLPPQPNTVKGKYRDIRVDHYLYEDAKKREEKFIQEQEAERERQRAAAKLQLNDRSTMIVVEKFEKELSEAFDEGDLLAPRKFADLTRMKNILQYLGALREVEPLLPQDADMLDSLWRILDNQKSGFVKRDRFIAIMREIVYPSSPRSIRQFVSKDLRSEIKSRLLAQARNRKKKIDTEKYTFTPRINSRSREMVTKKENGNSASKAEGTTLANSLDQLGGINIAINDIPSPNHSMQSPPRYERLFRAYEDRECKIKREKKQTEQRELAECTFAPKINKKYKPKKKNEPKKPHFEYLYEQGTKGKAIPSHPTAEEKELAQCTFKPDTTKHRTKCRKPKRSTTKELLPAGYSAAIKRLRSASQIRKENEAQKFHASLRSSTSEDTCSPSSKKTQPTSVKPFDFKLDKRRRSKPLMYLDVNLGPGKTGRIGIHRGDDPCEVAKNFAASYRLDVPTTQRLESMIRSTLQNTLPSEQLSPSASAPNSPNTQEKRDGDDWTQLFGEVGCQNSSKGTEDDEELATLDNFLKVSPTPTQEENQMPQDPGSAIFEFFEDNQENNSLKSDNAQSAFTPVTPKSQTTDQDILIQDIM